MSNRILLALTLSCSLFAFVAPSHAQGVVNTGKLFDSFDAAVDFISACEEQKGLIDCETNKNGFFCWCGERRDSDSSNTDSN